MISLLNDRLLWVAFGKLNLCPPNSDSVLTVDLPGVSLFFAVRGITAKLHQVQDLTEIRKVEKEDRMISEGAEDGMDFSAIYILFPSPINGILSSTQISHSSQAFRNYQLRSPCGVRIC